MKKEMLLFILSTLLSHAWIYAQGVYLQSGIYAETGFNTMGKINYTNSGYIDFKSEKNLSYQKSNEIGLKQQISKRSFISIGFSENAYNFTNNLYFPTGSITNNHIHIKSLFKLNYLGVNMGLDIALIQKNQWSIFTSGKLSHNSLNWGVITNKTTNAPPAVLPNLDKDLMLDENFKKQWFNIHFGLALSYEVSSKLSLYTEYNFNQDLTSIDYNQESYNFNSHTFCIGLKCNIHKRWKI